MVILLASFTNDINLTALKDLQASFKNFHLQLAQDKVKLNVPYNYLGILSLIFSLSFRDYNCLFTKKIILNTLQQFLGNINWL